MPCKILGFWFWSHLHLHCHGDIEELWGSVNLLSLKNTNSQYLHSCIPNNLSLSEFCLNFFGVMGLTWHITWSIVFIFPRTKMDQKKDSQQDYFARMYSMQFFALETISICNNTGLSPEKKNCVPVLILDMKANWSDLFLSLHYFATYFKHQVKIRLVWYKFVFSKR